MSQLAKFLDKYDILLFDMDGVVTSEQNYWTSAALTVWEWINSDKQSLSAADMQNNAAKIRADVFCSDRTIDLLKRKGVNSNWDLAYVVFAACKILDTTDFDRVYKFCEGLSDNILDEYSPLGDKLSEIMNDDGARNGKVWNSLMETFQEWFLGDALFEKEFGRKPTLCGKSGFLFAEVPVIDGEILKELFALLSKTGKRLATATGRVHTEIYPPLEKFGLLDYFAKDGIVNYTHVMTAEREYNTNLTKPHPYIFLKAMLGDKFPDSKIIAEDYDKSLISRTLVVGDAGADILAARAMGADFCAVLTGVSGQAGRGYFEEMKSEYIFDSLAGFLK
ncbi:MAG: HAD family hydrolase [Clostridia bacterium]|nr:HAD family hydrolase [Clostridia bacterium]